MTSFLTLEIKFCKVWQMGLSNILMFDFLSMSRGHNFFYCRSPFRRYFEIIQEWSYNLDVIMFSLIFSYRDSFLFL